MEVRAREEAAEPRVEGGGAHEDPWAGDSCSEPSIPRLDICSGKGVTGRGAIEGTGEDGTMVGRKTEEQRLMGRTESANAEAGRDKAEAAVGGPGEPAPHSCAPLGP